MFVVDYKNVPGVIENFSLANDAQRESLANLVASEAKYLNEHFNKEMTLYTLDEKPGIYPWLSSIFAERGLNFDDQRPIFVGEYDVKDIVDSKKFGYKDYGNAHFAWVIFASGMDANASYNLEKNKRRAVGFKLSVGMEEPIIFAENGFKFASMKSKIGGIIRGTYFVAKGEYL
ncbi:hypothetical protein [Lactovum miscens]|uniref:Phage tail protein n=1 Tax=Lactovum miscens TaxID=190387 RepID=A0A841C4J4_9LACT|nr:hypothetical protein [Lactovum miscens]MBB5887264.1 hypothetical protein [Lactovum miscens]